jgi:hypothetical protein
MSTPSKLRHSWLENQVFLLLRPSSPQVVTRQQALRVIDGWRTDMQQLLQYSRTFPGLSDPGTFLETFLVVRGLPPSRSELDELRERFRHSYLTYYGMTPSECREALLASAMELSDGLERLRERVDRLTPSDRVVLSMLEESESVFSTATKVHSLLATASPGVCIP